MEIGEHVKVFVTGVGGQLGHDVMNELAARGISGIGSDIAPIYSGIHDGSPVCGMPYIPMDITNHAEVSRVLNEVKPDVVIHCAAWTDVDAAEEPANASKVRAINAEGTRHIACACKTLDAKMVYISTDYVFSGRGEKPWQPDFFRPMVSAWCSVRDTSHGMPSSSMRFLSS